MEIILYLLLAVLALANIKLLTQLILSISYNLRRKKQLTPQHAKISIIVPAYNEERTITQCIQSLLKLDYPNYEIILIDDGSTDNTYQLANKMKATNLKVIHQENKGKSQALNNGIQNSTGEIIITVDADTTIDKQALTRIADRFATNKKIGALAGNVKVKAEPRLINALQSTEYATGINLTRKGQSVLGCVTIVPGPIAALKREAIQKVGLFSTDTFAEDFDLTLSILKKGYKIEYEEKSIAYTDTPKNTEDIIKQRRRWYRGMIQVLDKHKNMYFNPKYGIAGLLGVPSLWLEAVSPFFNLSTLLIVLLTWILSNEITLTLSSIIITVIIFLIVNILLLSLEPNPERRNYFMIPLLLFYNTFLDGIRIMSLTEETINSMSEWEKPKR